MAERILTAFSTDFGVEQIDTANDTTTLAGLTISSAAGIAMGGFGISGLADPTNPQDAVTLSYLQGFQNGLDWKPSVRLATAAALPANTAAGSGVGKTLTADANGALTVDGVAVAVSDRIIVKNEATGADNGIYTVTQTGDGSNPYILTRATDADQDAEVTAGLIAIVAEGTVNADTAWFVTTDDPITVDTTVITFEEFPLSTAVVAGAGLLKTGSQIDVELDTDADAQGAGADGGSSGLEFDVTGVGGQLRAKVDPAGGIQRGANGLLLEIDDTPNTLDVDADGLKVVGLPLQFLINDVATSTNVTAANVNTLTAGVTSAADALHIHNKVEQQYTAQAGVTAGDPVYSSSADQVTAAQASPKGGTGQQVIGVARTTAIATNPVQIVQHGVCEGVLAGATPGTAYFLGAAGGLTTTAPPASSDRVLVGHAKNATDLNVNIVFLGGL